MVAAMRVDAFDSRGYERMPAAVRRAGPAVQWRFDEAPGKLETVARAAGNMEGLFFANEMEL